MQTTSKKDQMGNIFLFCSITELCILCLCADSGKRYYVTSHDTIEKTERESMVIKSFANCYFHNQQQQHYLDQCQQCNAVRHDLNEKYDTSICQYGTKCQEYEMNATRQAGC